MLVFVVLFKWTSKAVSTYRNIFSLSFRLRTSDFHPTTMLSSSFSSALANPRRIFGSKLSTAASENRGLSLSFFSSSNLLPPPKADATVATPSLRAACKLDFLGSVFLSRGRMEQNNVSTSLTDSLILLDNTSLNHQLHGRH